MKRTQFTAAVLTVSDRSFSGQREDLGGPETARILTQEGFTVTGITVVPDDEIIIAEYLCRLCEAGNDLVVTTGGTGLSVRDVTPEATLSVCSRLIPGVAEEMRRIGMTKTDRAMLSRGVCGIRGKSLILNLPGSPKAIGEELPPVLSALRHGIQILQGTPEEKTDK